MCCFILEKFITVYLNYFFLGILDQLYNLATHRQNLHDSKITNKPHTNAMNKSYYTAYLPRTSSVRASPKIEDPNKSRLEELDRRLDKNLRSLTKVDEVCNMNLDKCKKYFNTARKILR